MKRIVLVLIASLLLVGCGGKESDPPQVQLDARAEATAVPAVTDEPVATAAPVGPTAAPEATETPIPTEEPTAEPAPTEEGPVEKLVASWNAQELLEGMYPMEAGDVLDLYGIDFTICRSAAAFGDAEGYTNEAVIVQADEAVLDEAEALLQDHLGSLKAQFRGYDPDALALAEKAVLIREGDILLFIISPNAEDMLAAFRSLTA